MLTEIGKVFTQVIQWTGEMVTALVGTDGALKDLLPLFALGIGMSAAMFVFKLIRKAAWGA